MDAPKASQANNIALFKKLIGNLEDWKKVFKKHQWEIENEWELKGLLGRFLWTIFSNNHDVINKKGEVHTIGSFRGSGCFIAEFLNQHYPSEGSFDYMDFYCSDMFFPEDADLRPIYELLFAKLQAEGCDWKYYFPRMHLISFKKQEQASENMENYNPTKAMQEQMKQEEKRKAAAKFQKTLDKDYEQRREDAKFKAPPAIVQSYQKVYGSLPLGYLED